MAPQPLLRMRPPSSSRGRPPDDAPGSLQGSLSCAGSWPVSRLQALSRKACPGPVAAKGEGSGEGWSLGPEDANCQYRGWIDKKALLLSTGNCMWGPGINQN